MKLDFQLKEGQQDSSLSTVRAEVVEGLNTLFRVKLELSCKTSTLDPKDYLGKKAQFSVLDNPAGSPLAGWLGVISEFSLVEAPWKSEKYFIYRVVIRPSLWKLAYNFKSRVLENQSRPDAIKQALKDGNITGFQIEPLNTSGAFPQLEQIVQFNETDLDFIVRTLRLCGLNFFYLPVCQEFDFSSVTDPSDYLRITDQTPSLKEQSDPIKLTYNREAGMVSNKPYVDYVGWDSRAVPESVSVQTHKVADAYQKYTPTNQKRKVDGGVFGEVNMVQNTAARKQNGKSWSPQDFADKVTIIRAAEMASWLKSGNGTSNDIRVRPCVKVTLDPDPLTGNSNSGQTTYLISRAEHLWQIGHRSEGDADYENTFSITMLDKDTVLHPPFITPWQPRLS